MTERLTIKNSDGTYSQPTDTTFEMVFNKLGRLEDILEKYGIESVEELNKKIGYYTDKIDLEAENDYLKKTIEKQNIVTQSILKDRDVWRSACELACETLKQVMGKPLWIGGNIPTPEVKDSEYFYQQAKNKEKEDERN